MEYKVRLKLSGLAKFLIKGNLAKGHVKHRKECNKEKLYP